jgi:hypothetical protein
MKHFFLRIIFSAILPLLTQAQLWEHSYGKPGYQDHSGFYLQHYDEGILTGGSSGILYEFSHTRLYKLDFNGDTLWTKLLSSVYDNQIQNIANTPDHGIVGAGFIYFEDIEGAAKPFVFKLDACGELEWCTYFETDRLLPWADGIAATDDGGYMVSLNSFGDHDTENTFLAKLDANGVPLWMKPVINPEIYTDARVPSSHSLQKTASGDYLVSGRVYWRHNPWEEVFWIRPFYALFDAQGNEKWVTPFGIADSLLGFGASCTELDSNYLLCAATQLIYQSDLSNGYLIELDGQGIVMQYRIILPEDIDGECYSLDFRDIQQIGDTLVLAMPFLTSITHYFPSILSLGLDVFGEDLPLASLRKFSDKMHYHLIGKTSDNKVFSAKRYRPNPNAPPTDMYLLKVDANLQTDSIRPDSRIYDYHCPHPISYSEVFFDNCHVVVNLQELMEKAPKTEGQRASFSIHPNPARDRIHIRFEKPVMQGQLEVYVYNTHGRLMLQPSGYNISEAGIDISGLPAGFYMVQLVHKGHSLGTKKLIKL